MGHKLVSQVLVGIMLCCAATGAACAQTAPSASEQAAYRGIHAAAASGDLSEIRKMIQQGADLNARDGNGRTALLIAGHNDNRDIVRALAAAGADMNAMDNQHYDIITIAAVRNDIKMVKLAIGLGANPRAITSPYEGTALIAAAHLGHAGVVKALIDANAPLDHVNNLGWTAAIEAVILGDGGPQHQATLSALVKAGANLALADRAGRTPLDHARSRSFPEMVRILTVRL